MKPAMKASTAVGLGALLFALVIFVHTLDYRELTFDRDNTAEAAMVTAPKADLFRQHAEAKFYTPFGQADCRAPRAGSEARVYVEWCTDEFVCYRSCSIERRDPNRPRSDIKKSALRRS